MAPLPPAARVIYTRAHFGGRCSTYRMPGRHRWRSVVIQACCARKRRPHGHRRTQSTEGTRDAGQHPGRRAAIRRRPATGAGSRTCSGRLYTSPNQQGGAAAGTRRTNGQRDEGQVRVAIDPELVDDYVGRGAQGTTTSVPAANADLGRVTCLLGSGCTCAAPGRRRAPAPSGPTVTPPPPPHPAWPRDPNPPSTRRRPILWKIPEGRPARHICCEGGGGQRASGLHYDGHRAQSADVLT